MSDPLLPSSLVEELALGPCSKVDPLVPVSNERPVITPPTPEPPSVRRPARDRGFLLDVGGESPLGCADVRGFREALLAAEDPSARAPQRLELGSPSAEAEAWLAAWAEDVDQVRRTITLRRRWDGQAFTAIVTLSSFGGVAPSLSVESVSAPHGEGEAAILRSGVHLRPDVDALLARRSEAAELAGDGHDRGDLDGE